MKRSSIRLGAQLLPLFLNTRGKQRLSILIYHRVLPDRDALRPDEPTVAEFDWQMRILREAFHPLSLLDAIGKMRAGTLPERAVCVTFDDGYADNERHALPVLLKYAIPATVFVSTGFLNGGRMWNDTVIETFRNVQGDMLDLSDLELECYSLNSNALRLAAANNVIGRIKHLELDQRMNLVRQMEGRATALPDDLMMTDDQVVRLANNGISVGAHTVNHPILSSVDEDVALQEIQYSKSYLENLLGEKIEVFAYPNGKPEIDYSAIHRDMVEGLGFKVAVSTHWGSCTRQSDAFQLPRFTPWDKKELKFALRLLGNYRRVDPLVAGQ